MILKTILEVSDQILERPENTEGKANELRDSLYQQLEEVARI